MGRWVVIVVVVMGHLKTDNDGPFVMGVVASGWTTVVGGFSFLSFLVIGERLQTGSWGGRKLVLAGYGEGQGV